MYSEIAQVLLQTIACAGIVWSALRYFFHVETPDLIKVGLVSAIAVAMFRFFWRSLCNNENHENREKFVVEWGAVGLPDECESEQSPPPPQSDVWSDPQIAANARIEAALYATAQSTKKIEEFLRVNVPDQQQAPTAVQNV